MKVERLRYILVLMMALFVLPVQATKVTYHILTLPITSEYHMKSEVLGHRLEAVKIVVDNQTAVELPAQYKSPLATNFKYYKPEDITIGSVTKLYDNTGNPNKGILYDIKAGSESKNVSEGSAISGTTAEYYVVYTYNTSNTIAKLDGSVNYNIGVRGNGFLSLNRGRNNRPAVVPTAKVDPEMLASEDFSKVENPGEGISTYWNSNDNKNIQADVGSQFHFIFHFEGQDPYNIIICSSYNKDTTYIEKNDDGDKKFVYKWYKGSQLFAVGNANSYFASDVHKRYKTEYNSAIPNPVDPTYDDKNGQFHGQSGAIWSSFALLNNTTNDGYVFMGMRTVDNNGVIPTPGTDNKYNYLKLDHNNLTINKLTAADATKSYTIEGIYPIKKVTFKVPTPFYQVSATADHIVSVEDYVSQYTVDNDPIETKYLPAALRRKYCSFNGKFYKDPARTQQITHFSQATDDPTEGYQVYLGYEVSASIPFKAITPASTYDATTWRSATWYELTDAASTQIDGMKLKYDGAKFNNDGADGVYDKTSEFAFIGDPYELQVVYRNTTSGATPYFVGAAGTPPTSATNLTISTSATEGYIWQMPYEATSDNFLLEKYKDEGNWYWEVTRPAPVAIAYGTKTHTYNVATANAQTVTFNVSGLTYTADYYITVTAGGTNADQVTVPGGKIYVEEGGTADFVAVIKGRGDSDKTFTLSVQQYKADNTADGSPSVITVNQNSSDISSHTVQYSTASSTRVKVMELPKFDFTYNIVDKAGNIAVKATASQTIFSPLSIASIPSVIVSPVILDETITFYRAYSGPSRTNFNPADIITELSAGNASSSTNVYVSYTTELLDNKPIVMSDDQEFNVVYNGQYLYFDGSDNSIKTTATPSDLKDHRYLWKLRNRDPYAMLVDNVGAREDPDFNVADVMEEVTFYADDGTPTVENRSKGAWVKLAAALGNDVVLAFTTDRSLAQRFIAKSSAAAGAYEVMVAAGSSIDAATTYYNIGRPADNTVKIYDNAHYAHTNDVLKCRLEQSIAYTYHLIDKSNHELLTHTSQNADLALPEDYQSPLVGRYHFYDPDNITQSDGIYTVNPSATELYSLADLDATVTDTVSSTESAYNSAGADFKHEATSAEDIKSQAKRLTILGDHYYKVGESYYVVTVSKACYYDIYVTYDVNDLIGFNNTGRVNDHPYLLRFLEPFADGYYLEDGNDKLTSTQIQAVYPYCNGDGNLNIYGSAMRDEQMNGGSSTRPRWVWYFESTTNDPYHVRIHSRSTISYNSVNHQTYLETKAVHFNQSAAGVQNVVTGGSMPGVASTEPTEYMILGIAGAFKLMTTQPIQADLDGDGNTTGPGENERRKVTSFEQYWKTYNMLKLHVLGISASTDAYSDDEATWVVPTTDNPATGGVDESTYRATLAARGWHSYDAYANAVRWNGYNDKSDGHEKKLVEKLEHWFQTFEMGNGTFDVESADIPPVLVLLDRHGWEIMRRPLPAANYPEGAEELAALRVYDSPLVKEYKFYSQATKATGCHKYTLRMQDGAERDQIKVNGVHYTSTSLGDLPPVTATGVMSNGVLNDQFVTYTVKEEYEMSYAYNFTDNGDNTYTESGTPTKFLILQNSRFARDNGGTGDRISYLSKPIQEASKPVGGNVYDMIMSPQTETVSNVSTDVDENNDGNIDDKNLWYIQPNLNIDKEMGIKWALVSGGTGEPLTEYETKKAYKDKTGFDPYNMQLQNVGNSQYLTTHMTFTKLENGIMVGDYSGVGDSENVTFGAWVDVKNADTSTPKMINDVLVDEGYDHTNLKITNQTFMAVSDANGNMQLMPRFDHTKRMNVTLGSSSLTTLQNPVDHEKANIEKNSSMGPQTIFLVHPERFIYHIIDNNGREAMTYKRAGDDYPAITEHFKSPLAKDFTYYTGLAESDSPAASTDKAWGAATGEFKRTANNLDSLNNLKNLLPVAGIYQYRVGVRGDFTYYSVTVTKGLLEQEITGSFEDKKLFSTDNDVYVRYNYDESADFDADRILEGQWFTVKLADKDLQSAGTLAVAAGPSQGTGINLYTGTKPGTINSNEKEWQWKFRTAPADPSSDYYELPDPYAVQLFNRQSNYTTDPSLNPSPMAVGIKVPNDNGGFNRFALLSHPNGGYAMAVAKNYSNNHYLFLNGGSMTTPDAEPKTAADTVAEVDFTYKNGIISNDAQVVLNKDVVYHYIYNVINNDSVLAVRGAQDNEDAISHNFIPYLPDSVQTLLLNMDDYLYYGFARKNIHGTPADPSDDTYGVIEQTKLYTLYGLYDDTVYVRYSAYDVDKTEFKVPNEKAVVDGHVARGEGSHDVSMYIDGSLPYNIIWYNDNMMASVGDGNTVSFGTDQNLTGNKDSVWYITGNDPYGLRIKHKTSGSFINGTNSLVDTASSVPFMLLKKEGYDYGVLQKTGDLTTRKKLTISGDNLSLTENASVNPTKFIIFGLSVHELIYRLIIAKTCPDSTAASIPTDQYVDIPYMATESGTMIMKRIYGTTQRDLTSKKDDDEGNLPGSKYQLGTTLSWGGTDYTYCHDAGSVSIGDDLWVPNEFYRPNCTFEFYIEGVYGADGTAAQDDLNSRFKGLKLTKLMSASELIDKTVVVNIVYKFDQDLATNTGLGFVTSTAQNLWYTFETPSGVTPYLAHYTNAWGLQSMAGRETHYTNDYLWTPLGDVYGFKMYNRYMLKNSGGVHNVMTYAGLADENKSLLLAEAGTGGYTEGNEIFELIAGDQEGNFRVHPVVNNSGTQYYVRRDPTDDYIKLSTTPADWRFGLDMYLLEPYYDRAGYVGGLTAEGKAAYEAAVATEKIIEIQNVVYNDANIVPFTSGYYRLHNQPGVSSISPVRYASGYLHDIEKTAVSGGIPMHFYSKAGVSSTYTGEEGLISGFTVTNATRGDIPIDPTEYDPSTIFYMQGGIDPSDPIDTHNPRVTMQTQGLYVAANPNGDANNGTTTSKLQRAVMSANSANAITFSVMDIGGAVLLIHDGATPAIRRYLNYDQTEAAGIYDLRYYHESPVDDAKWCLKPVQKTSTVGNGEMPLMLTTNDGGDGYYYATFYAPFDVLLPADAAGHTYNAYTCRKWYDEGVNPVPVPAANTYAEGKFVPAGTPVIIRTTDESESVTLALPTATPSSPISCIFTGSYLEKLLPVDAAHDVYTLGLPMISDVSKAGDYVTSGDIVAPLPEFDNTGVGFYINATRNKEKDPLEALWTRNNRYVLHNKIYYRADGSSSAPPRTGSVPFVPVLFDGDEEQPDNGQRTIVGDGCVYDILGRKVASEAEVKDGTWRQRLEPGVYIVGGEKILLGAEWL